MTNSNSWNKVKNIENSMKTDISSNKDTLYYKDIIPAFFEICSNPTYYGKLASLGLVKKTTIDNVLKLISNKSNEELAENLYLIGRILNLKIFFFNSKFMMKFKKVMKSLVIS